MKQFLEFYATNTSQVNTALLLVVLFFQTIAVVFLLWHHNEIVLDYRVVLKELDALKKQSGICSVDGGDCVQGGCGK